MAGMSHPFSEGHPGTLASVGRVEEWEDGQAREVKVHKKPMTVVRMGERFFAVNSICPHMGGPLSCGKVARGSVHCPWHDWSFDVETGLSPNGHRIDRYHTEVKDGQVMVGWIKS
jgi:nitrite reductase (NADH) small subunit/3-phenylpropionate/trans-cinnamate dioxygenase ferredoxin subunit